MSTLILSDGTKINNIGGGPVFVSKNEITEETFRGKLRGVKIIDADDGGNEIISGPYHLEQVGPITKRGGFWNVVLQVMPPEKEKLLELQAQVAYLSMMSDIDLPA